MVVILINDSLLPPLPQYRRLCSIVVEADNNSGSNKPFIYPAGSGYNCLASRSSGRSSDGSCGGGNSVSGNSSGRDRGGCDGGRSHSGKGRGLCFGGAIRACGSGACAAREC